MLEDNKKNKMEEIMNENAEEILKELQKITAEMEHQKK